MRSGTSFATVARDLVAAHARRRLDLRLDA